MHAKKVVELLDTSDLVGKLTSQAEQLLALRQALSEALPANLGRSCEIANLKQGKLVIFAENSSIAAKVRLFEPQLTEIFARGGWNVTGMTIRVQPAQPTPVTSYRKQATLSETAEYALTDLAAKLPEGRLARAVRSLSRRRR